jgi:dodecin
MPFQFEHLPACSIVQALADSQTTYPQGKLNMSSVAKIIEMTASSSKSIEDAVETGIRRADETLDNVEGAWVQDIKCVVKNGKIAEWRVNMKVTFLLND